LKLNIECMREVLLVIEKDLEYFTNDEGEVEKATLYLRDISNAIPNFSQEDIFYSLYNLDQAGYVDISVKWLSGAVYSCAINNMTYTGHEFLESIRDPKCWGLIKKGVSSVSNFSLAAISAIAEGITSAAITTYLGKL